MSQPEREDVMTDVEVLRRRVCELEASEATLQATIESLPFDFFVVDADGRYSLQNSACREHWGDVIGKRPEDVAPSDDLRALWLENNGRAFAGELVDDEVEVPVNGRSYIVKNVIAPIRSGNEINGILGINIDVTARKEVERALRESEDKYHTLSDNVPIGVYRSLPTNGGVMVSANPALHRMFGYDPGVHSVETVPVTGLYADPSDRVDLLERVRENGAVEHHEVRLRRRDGSTFWGAISARGLFGDDGELLYIDGTISDITDAKNAREDLKNNLGRLQRTIEGTVSAMASMVEMRDPYTSGHQRRVAKLASTIATRLGLDHGRVTAVRLAGLIHDVGKIAVPSEILSKPGPISNLERELIKNHPRAGFDILKAIESPWPIAEIVLQHHEKLDGSGYPLGLKGNSILFEARILAVADIVEAMASHRPYRPAYTIDLAVDEVLEGTGHLFDPDVVEVCVGLLRDGTFDFNS